MGLLNFNRNKSGNTYDGKEVERKGALDKIKWEIRDGDDLVYKYPYDNIVSGSVLVVNETQTAFLFKGGAYYDSFPAGTHVLTTENIPFLQGALNAPTGGETAYTAEVWFVNKTLEKRDMNWGAGGMHIFDPYYGIRVKIGAHGQYGFKISDAEIFIRKMVGTIHSVTSEKIYDQFRSDIVQEIKDSLAKYLKKEKNLNVTDLSGNFKEIAQFTKQSLDETYSDYGIELIKFVIEDITPDESDEALMKAKEGEGLAGFEKRRIDTLGDKYAQARQFDVMEKAAENEAAGGMMGGMMGAGMGAGMGIGMGNMMSNGMQQQMQQQAPQAAAPPPPPQAAQFHITQNGQTSGPYSMQQMQEYAQQNILMRDTLVWKNGMSGWANAETVPELQSLFQAAPPPPPPPPPPM